MQRNDLEVMTLLPKLTQRSYMTLNSNVTPSPVNRILSIEQNTAEQNEKALSAHDGKRVVLDNGENILALAHYKVNIEKYTFLSTRDL